MTLQRRIKALEKVISSPIAAKNPYEDWTDEELELSISLLDKEIQTGQKQEWPEELTRKQAALPCTPCELDELSDEELEAMIARLEADLQRWRDKPLYLHIKALDLLSRIPEFDCISKNRPPDRLQ